MDKIKQLAQQLLDGDCTEEAFIMALDDMLMGMGGEEVLKLAALLVTYKSGE